jgi:hypothetical protein
MKTSASRVRRGLRSKGAAAALLVSLAMPAALLAAGAIDQAQEVLGSSRGLIGTYDTGSNVKQGQTFTAGASGNLDQVDLPIRVVGNPGVALTVEILSLGGGGLPATVLASATVLQGSVPACNTTDCISLQPSSDFTTFSFVSIPFSAPAAVSAGTSYAIAASATGAQLDIYGDIIGRTANRYEWAGTSDFTVYSGGDGVAFIDGTGWYPSNSERAFRTYVSAGYSATVGQPINIDGSSVFKANRGVVPVKFTLSAGGSATCGLPAATIALTRTAGVEPGPVTEATYLGSADSGSTFRISDCQYIYNLNAKSLGAGTYLVEISIGGQVVGSASFEMH